MIKLHKILNWIGSVFGWLVSDNGRHDIEIVARDIEIVAEAAEAVPVPIISVTATVVDDVAKVVIKLDHRDGE